MKSLALFANMMCKGSDVEKAKTLYHILQTGSGGSDSIANNDKEFLYGVKMWVHEVVQTPCVELKDKREFTEEILTEKVHALIETTNDIIFSHKTQIQRGYWEETVSDKCKWLLNPAKLREKVFSNDLEDSGSEYSTPPPDSPKS